MSIQSHLHTLQVKHAEFETAIGAEMARPLPNFLAITDLEKKKLAIKQEMERFAKAVPASNVS